MELEFRNRKIILRESIGLETNGLLDILSTGMFRVYTIWAEIATVLIGRTPQFKQSETNLFNQI